MTDNIRKNFYSYFGKVRVELSAEYKENEAKKQAKLRDQDNY